ncbi:MAG: CopG family ribbon-helix-helix protein [Candidatus Limnocylindria bacterium]
MRTTVTIDDQLLMEVKTVAARSGRTISEVIDDALRAALQRRQTTAARRVQLPSHAGGGLQPGVDLDDSADLLDRMDGR